MSTKVATCQPFYCTFSETLYFRLEYFILNEEFYFLDIIQAIGDDPFISLKPKRATHRAMTIQLPFHPPNCR